MQKTIDFAVKNCIYHALYPLEIGQIIVAIYPNYSLVIASMLCTTINISDPKITKSDLTKIKNNFGLDIVKLVKNYLKISFNNYLQNDLNQTRTILLEIDKDLKIEVLLVRLAYLLHYISLFNRIQITKEQSQYIIVEILEVYLPLITELGINDIQTKVHKFFLKNLLFSASERDIIDYLNTIKDAELVIYNIADKIRDNLQHAEIKAVISARIKSFCSIQQKMENKSIRLDQLNDIIALRVIIDSTHDALARCYTVLKLLHNDYEFLPEKVQDFIKVPKQNGYQSLHTIIIGPTKQKIEVQIRTSKMHEVAQSGSAAHWRYKSNFIKEKSTRNTIEKLYGCNSELHNLILRVRLLYKDKLVSITLFCTIDSAVLFFAKELNLRTGSINDANIDFNVSIPFMQFNIKNQQFTVPSNQDLEFDNQFVNNIIANSSTRASNKKDAETFRNYIVYSLISITCINSDCSLKLGQRQNNQQSYRKADNIASNKPHSIIFRQNAISRSFNIENRKDAVIRTADQSKAEQITIPLIQSVKMNGVKNNNKLFLIDQYQQVITVLTAFLMTNMNVNKKFDTVYSKSTDNITYNKLFSALTDSIETSNEHVNEDNTMITNTVSDECNEYTEEKFIFDIIKDNIRNEDKKIVKNYIKCNNENIEVNDAINIIKALIRINRTKVLEQKLYQVLEYVISTINEQIFDNADTFSQAIDIFETIVNETLIELITSKQILPVFLSIIIKEQQYAPLIVLLLGSKFIDNELFKIFTTYKIENGDTIHSMVLQFIYESKCDECFDVTALAMHLLRTYNIKGVNDNAIIECDEFFDVTASAIYLLRAYNIKGVNNTAIIECVFAISSIAKSNGINLINELIKYQLDDGNTVFSILLKYIEEQKSCNLVNSICKSLRNIDKEKDEDMELCKKIFTESIDTLLSAALEYAKVKNDCKPILNIIKISETVEKLCPGLYNKLIDYKTLCGDTLQSVILKYITQNFHGNPKDYITTIEVATEFLFFSSKKDIEFVQQFLNFKIDEDNEKNVISIWHAILEYLAIDEYDLELQPKYNIVWLIFNILINIKEKDTESKFSAELINYSTPYGETFFSVISKLIKASSTEIEKRKDSITMYQTEIYKEELIPKKTGFHQECPILKEFINISRLKANLADELQDYEILKQCEEFIKEIVVELVHIFHAFMDDAFGEIVNHAIGKNSELFLNILEFINISKEVSGNLEKEIEELYNYIIVILAECDTKYLSKETFNNVLCFQDKKHQPFFATRANFLELQHKNMDKKTDQEEISNMIRNRIIGIIHILQHEYTDLKIFKKSFGNQNLNNCIKWLQKHEHTIMTPPIAEITKYMIRLRDNIEKLDFTTTENTNIELNIDDYLQPGTSEVTKEKDITNAKMFSSGSSEDEIFSGSSEDEEINYMGG